MRILVVGGSGYVGGLVLPQIARQHTLRIFDLRPPIDPGWEYIAGNVGNFDALVRAATGMDVLLYMAMGNKHYESSDAAPTNFDVNVKGVYLALQAAHMADIKHAVYTSSMSVYGGNLNKRYFPDEEITPDASSIYGLTKRLGEEVCRNAARVWAMSVNVLRLCYPTPEDEWCAATSILATAGSDVARALLAAFEYRGCGFQAFMISGDYEQKLMNMSKAKRLLGWEPQARRGE